MMADFLSNLLDRALGQGPILQPRPLSRFERWPESAGQDSSDAEDDGLPNESIPRPTEARVPRAPTQHAPPKSAPVFAPSEDAARDDPPPTPRETQRSQPPLRAEPIAEFREKKAGRETPAPIRIEHHVSRIETIERVVEKAAPVSPASLGKQPRLETIDQPRKRAPLSPAHTEPAAGPSGERDRSRKPAAPRETIPPKTTRPLSKPAEPILKPIPPLARRVPAAVPAPVAPEIRVTIGRLEIRAVKPPPARPAKGRPATPRLSLDDYLRSRSGGNGQ